MGAVFNTQNLTEESVHLAHDFSTLSPQSADSRADTSWQKRMENRGLAAGKQGRPEIGQGPHRVPKRGRTATQSVRCHSHSESLQRLKTKLSQDRLSSRAHV